MSLANDFESFCSNIKLDNLFDINTTVGEIAKKLNKHYYDVEGDSENHMYMVGSVGRGTAIEGNSDVDILFDLPDEIYKKYNDYENNGQSALLQEVKNVLIERYPKTDIRGDGQVVVIEFSKFTIELVPGFQQEDNRFKYPDTHDGGSWKYTDPLSEQEECANFNDLSNGIYFDFCHIIRMWKENIDFKMGGLLIDTLVYNCFQDMDFSSLSTDDYFDILTDLYEYLKDQDPNQSYWLAIGSNQQVYNSDDGVFVSKAEQAHGKLKEVEDIYEANDILRELLGNKFPEADDDNETNAEYSAARKYCTYPIGPSEEFIEDIVPMRLQYNLRIDCQITQNGWRPFYLRDFFKSGKKLLKRNRSLDFFIRDTNCPAPYEIWWKIRNVGPEAERRNMIRGNILQTNSSHKNEHTNFFGPHYVECFLIKNQTCVARDKIDVPIE